MVLRQHEARCVGCELPQRDLDVAALPQLDHMLGDRIVEAELATLLGERHQRGVEDLPDRTEIEHEIGGDRRAAIGEAIVEEAAVPIEAKRDRDAPHVLAHARHIARDGCGERVRRHCPRGVRHQGERDHRSDKELPEDADQHVIGFDSRPA